MANPSKEGVADPFREGLVDPYREWSNAPSFSLDMFPNLSLEGSDAPFEEERATPSLETWDTLS